MRLVKYTALCLVLTFSLLGSQESRAEMDPKLKAIGLMAAYGAVGGTLLGVASLAFGTEGRSVAKGASLGLYAGLLFGSYVVISHAYRKHKTDNPDPKDNYYPDTSSSPYEEEEEQGGGGWFDFGGGGSEEGTEGEGGYERWNSNYNLTLGQLNPIHGADKVGNLKPSGKVNRPVFYMPLFLYQF